MQWDCLCRFLQRKRWGGRGIDEGGDNGLGFINCGFNLQQQQGEMKKEEREMRELSWDFRNGEETVNPHIYKPHPSFHKMTFVSF